MAEKKESSLGEIKKAVIGVVTLGITTGGGLFIANMEKIFEGREEVKVEQVVDSVAETQKDTIVVINKIKEPQVVAKPEAPKEKEFNW